MSSRKIRVNLGSMWYAMCSDLDRKLISRQIQSALLKVDTREDHKLTAILGFEIVRVLQLSLRKLQKI